jgi:hypothetical protein
MNGLPEREASTRCKEYKAMADRVDTKRALPSNTKCGVSSIQVQGVATDDSDLLAASSGCCYQKM